MKRRKFLNTSTMAATGVLVSLSSCGQSNPADGKILPTDKGKYPMVISTWNNWEANQKAMSVLEVGKSALDAIEAGIHVPEANPDDMSVGYGGRPDRDGNVTLDACIMDEKGNCGSVTYLQNIKHPISVARKVMEDTPHVMLSGRGAELFATASGFKKENLLTAEAERQWKEWLIKKEYKPQVNIELHDTIGMLCIDKGGNISGGCSTSGLGYKMQGRVGDSPIIGAGLYVDNEVGAATATGMGEAVVKSVGSFLIVELMRNGYSPQEACEEAIRRIVSKQDTEDIQVAFIAIDKNGNFGTYAIKPGFVCAINYSTETTVYKADSHST